MLSSTWGLFEKDNFVYYLYNGSPVHVHDMALIHIVMYLKLASFFNTEKHRVYAQSNTEKLNQNR